MPAEVTVLLRKWCEGDSGALDELAPLVYTELRRIARRYWSREASGHTLQGTALVHEAYLRLVEQKPINWQDRAHFFGIAARTMRRILIERGRRRTAEKRSGGPTLVNLSRQAMDIASNVDFVLLDNALTELDAIDPRGARVVEMRFFAGFTEEEIATLLGISEPTVRRDWTIAKAWLFRKMNGTTKPRPGHAAN
jgi:RNA polymerase sigma factor (TIGR02999 family)